MIPVIISQVLALHLQHCKDFEVLSPFFNNFLLANLSQRRKIKQRFKENIYKYLSFFMTKCSVMAEINFSSNIQGGRHEVLFFVISKYAAFLHSRLSVNEFSEAVTATGSAFITTVTNMLARCATPWLDSNHNVLPLQPQTADCLISYA